MRKSLEKRDQQTSSGEEELGQISIAFNCDFVCLYMLLYTYTVVHTHYSPHFRIISTQLYLECKHIHIGNREKNNFSWQQ